LSSKSIDQQIKDLTYVSEKQVPVNKITGEKAETEVTIKYLEEM
jgi:hypothetical protein